MKRIFPILGMTILLCAALITLAITGETAKDPVCGMEVNTASAAFTVDSPHGTIYFCSQHCKDTFLANPAAYTPKMESAPAVPAAPATPAAETKKSGCEGCAGHAKAAAAEKGEHGSASHAMAASATTTTEHGCDGNCGNTQIKAINEFHTLMTPLESGEGQAHIALVKGAAADLVAKKDEVMKSECPGGVCTESYKAMRADFGLKVDALAAAANSGDESAIAAAFKEMHAAYQSLDVVAR
ncbi:MAG TPA: YHS domain-containing protein [bacterium]|jgi:YHS domain-containing protein